MVFGLYTHILDLGVALADWKGKNGAAPEFTWANCPPNAIETFPGSYDELFAYNAGVLSDVNFKAIGDIGFEMLCDYVAEGGSLVVAGGPYALGNGEFEDTRFLEVLPAKLGREPASGNMRLKAGMDGIRLRLHPGESIRTPRILLLHWRTRRRQSSPAPLSSRARRPAD